MAYYRTKIAKYSLVGKAAISLNMSTCSQGLNENDTIYLTIGLDSFESIDHIVMQVISAGHSTVLRCRVIQRPFQPCGGVLLIAFCSSDIVHESKI
jgi:hypothetical protein